MSVDSQFDLLSLKERLSENLSSAQLADTLDDLIFSALRPIMFATDHIEQTLAEMIPFVASNGRRKFAVMPQHALVDALFSFINGVNKKEKFKLLRSTRLERTIYFSCLRSFDNLASIHHNLSMELLKTPKKNKEERYLLHEKIKSIERRLHLKPNKNLFSIRAKSKCWYDLALDFRGMIMEKYVRLAFMDSMKAQKDTDLQIDPKDLFKDYILAIAKAIDKYDPQQGALTSYIRWWFMDASTPFKGNGHEYGINFHVPTAQRKKLLETGMGFSNFSIQLDDSVVSSKKELPNALESIIEDEDTTQLYELAVKADTNKMAILSMGITYPLSYQDKVLLSSTMVKGSYTKTQQDERK